MSSPLATSCSADPSTSNRPKLRHIRELDGARGVAALMVFFHHVGFSTVHGNNWSAGVQTLQKFSSHGNAGVDLFFVLSGFLISSILIEARPQPSYFRDFYWKRALRILPLYFLCLLGVLIHYPGSLPGVSLSALFLINFGARLHIGIVGPFWSLAIEEQFYLVWPAVVRRRSVRQLARLAIALAISVILIRVAAGFFNFRNYYYTFYRCDGLAFGALIACWFKMRSGTISERRLENIVLNFGLAAGILVYVSAVHLPAGAPIGISAALGQTGVCLISAGVIARLVRDSGRNYLAPFRSPVLTFFGLISYAFYMLHLYVLDAFDHLRPMPAAGDNTGFVIRLFAILLITIAAALASRYLVELPALSLRKYVLRAPSPAPVTAEPLSEI